MDEPRPVRAIRNSDIRWSGTLLGLDPFIEGQASKAVLAAGPASIPDLIEALDDPWRWVAAHVLLTQVTPDEGGPPPIEGRASQRWWGLKVRLFADGRVEFDPDDRPVLRKYWRDRMARHRDGAPQEAGDPTGG